MMAQTLWTGFISSLILRSCQANPDIRNSASSVHGQWWVACITAHLKLTTLEDMCVDLDYAKSGTKEEKISRIFPAFFQEGDIVRFLLRLRNETLKDILMDFSNKFKGAHITFTGNKGELVRRIVQVSQLVS